jgi:hypothetical protein
MCFNCSGQLLTLSPMPTSLKELRRAVSRERRRVDRRVGKADTRVFRYERRVGERRLDRESELSADADAVVEISVEEMQPGDGMEFDDLTSIRELVTHLRPVGIVS